MAYLSKFILASVFSLGIAASASAQIIIHGTGAARDCYLSTKAGNPGNMTTIRKCEEALSDKFNLSRRDEAATHVNIGVLYMRRGDNEEAQTHYKKAIDLRPETPEAYINYGASLIYTGNYNDAVTAINTAIDLKTEKMPEALFNRAIAYDRLENYKGAYKDLKQALVLKPEWPAALKALENYAVIKRPKSN